jgi:predicted DNA-binding WGR domain protein
MRGRVIDSQEDVFSMRRFELIEGTASKFWEIEQVDTELNIRWGRIGTAGQSQTKSFADAAKATTALGKLVTEKTGKGYSETGVAAGAVIGKTEAKPKAEAAEKTTAAPAAKAAPASAAVPAATAAATATADADAPSEGIDSQADRVFEAVRSQIEAGALTQKDSLSTASLKRQHGVSEQGAALAFKRLKAAGLLYGWGASCTPAKEAQAIAKELGTSASTTPPSTLAMPAADLPVSADTPPWLAAGVPVRMSPDMVREALPSRRFPPAPFTEPVSVAAAWLPVRRKLDLNIDMAATDAGLRDATQRMLDRGAQPIPAPDAEADTVLLALALSTGSHYGSSEMSAVLVQYLVAQYGLPGAIDLLLAAQQIQMHSSYDRKASKHLYSFSAGVTGPMGSTYYGPIGDGEKALRAHLALAAPEVWQDCRDRIEAGLPKVHASRQPALAMLLPDAPEVSNALVHALAADKNAPEMMHWLQLTATDPDAIALAAKVRLSYSSGFWGSGPMTSTLVQERGVDAVAVLERGAATDDAGDALACIGTPDAVLALARVASTSKSALARLALAVDRWPMAAIPALSRLVASGGKDANMVTPSLTRLLRAHGALLPALRPWLDAGAQAVIARQLALLAGPAETAEAGELPGVLAAPPWLAKVQKKAAAALVLEPLALAPVEQWGEGERESALRLNSWQTGRYDAARKNIDVLLDELGFDKGKKNLAPLVKTAAAAVAAGDAGALVTEWRAMVAERKKERYYWFSFRASFAALLPAAVGVPFWNAVAGEAESDDIGLILATHGLAVLPGLAAMVRSKPTENLSYALNFGAPELAMPAARAFAKLKTLRAEGRAWLLKYPEHTACGLIAPALGKAGEARDCAGSALRLLQANGHEALLLEVAGRYGRPEVIEALRAVLDESPLDRFPTKRAKLPEFWQPRGWRRPTLKNGKALPDDALDNLGQMLTFPTNEEIYGGIAVVKEVCDAGSLAEFAWDAFTAWLEAGGPSKEGWALTMLGFFGNDDTARKLTPFIRAWPGESAHARAVTGLDVLAAIGSDVALMLLNGIAQKVKFKGLQDKAREKIDAIAEARGLSTEELEDRLAPDLGLDEQGTMRLDFGPRAFKVGFDETLKPYVRETTEGVDGARLPDLPKPKKTDDAELSKEAVERFKLLKKDARTIASQQLLRLEVAMCARRRWTPEVFRTFLVEHPLVRHIVQRLIWGVYEVEGATEGSSYGGALKACFRVAEDGSYTTAEDDPFELPEGANIRIGVPHALELPAADAAAFGQVFADYELLQPFAQIGRDVYTLTDDELKSLKLERWKDAKVPTGRVLGLANKGWRRGQAQDGGCIWYFSKPLGTQRVIELSLDPGIIVGMVDEYPEQTLGQVQVGKPSGWGDMRDAETLDLLDPISASELIRDMEGLRA